MRRIASNSVATAGDRSTKLLLLLLFVTDHLRISVMSMLGSNNSLPIVEDSNYNSIHADHRGFLRDVDAQRENTSASIMDFKFNVNRIRVLSKSYPIPKVNKGILYWMNRDHRVQDNWALLYAQKIAIQNKVPLHVAYCRPKVVDISFRQYKFMCEGLRKVERECRTLNIEFHFLIGNSTETLSHLVRNRTLGLVVDFSPLRDDVNMFEQLVLAIGSEVPVIQIDAHNVVPCWVLAYKQLRDSKAMRIRMYKKLDEYLTEFPPVIKHPYTAYPKARPTDWNMGLSNLEVDDPSIQTLPGFEGGYIPGMSSLSHFIEEKLANYHINRHNPLIDGLSKLSPWLHFGQISAQRVVLEVLKFKNSRPSGVYAYKGEILLRREMFENYCYYNSKYDSIEGAPLWAQNSLLHHRNDKRKLLFTREQFENGHIEDLLWIATNNQMKKEGMIHRFLRPYWAKKILEYSKTPEEALATAIYLNNKYSLDGNDPCSYGGIMWAMTGLYDERCSERPVFGKVRYAHTAGMRNKINAYAYIIKMQDPHDAIPVESMEH